MWGPAVADIVVAGPFSGSAARVGSVDIHSNSMHPSTGGFQHL